MDLTDLLANAPGLLLIVLSWVLIAAAYAVVAHAVLRVVRRRRRG